MTISPEGKITDVNEATVKVTGVPRDRLIGTDFSDYFTEPEKARYGYQEVFEKGFVTDYPLTIRHKEGHVTVVLYNASVYRDADGNVSVCLPQPAMSPRRRRPKPRSPNSARGRWNASPSSSGSRSSRWGVSSR